MWPFSCQKLNMWPFSCHKLGPVSPSFYTVSPLALGADEVRILHLHHGFPRDEITCSLENIRLPPRGAAPPEMRSEGPSPPDLDCTTLSYQWSHPKRCLRKIQCNSVDFYVTMNLYSALHHLRDETLDLALWVDAICINQDDDAEKGKQVQRMREIYSRSKHTIIWLGEGGFFSREAFSYCSTIAAWHRNRNDPPTALNPPQPAPNLTRPWDPWEILPTFFILLLLRRSYFSRIWIIQEVALSHSLDVACGASRISWRDFALAASGTLLTGIGSRNAEGIGNIMVARAILPGTPNQGFDDPAWIFRTLMQQRLPLQKNILAVAALFRGSHATDPVDKLFGVVGLCEQIQGGSTYGIKPVYRKDDPNHKNRVYISTSRSILASQDSLDLFSAISRQPPQTRLRYLTSLVRVFLLRERSDSALPTWVPDWSETNRTATPLSLILAQNDTPNVGQQEGCDFTLSQSSQDPYCPYIWLSGRFLDEIAELGAVCNTEKAHKSWWFSIKFAFTMSESHRLEVLDKWGKQFRAPEKRLWRDLIATATCKPHYGDDEDAVMPILTKFRTRGPQNLPAVAKGIFGYLFVMPILITLWTANGILERVLIYWMFPLAVFSTMWYWTFQLVPNFIFLDNLGEHGVGDNSLREDFENMELRRMARLKTGHLALVPEASCVGDQVWGCRGGKMPLVLRSHGDDFEMVGECYSDTMIIPKKPKAPDTIIRLV